MVKFGMRSGRCCWLPKPAAAVGKGNGEAGRLQDGDVATVVAGPLRDLALADRASASATASLGITTARICMMITLVMYGMIPSANTANWVSTTGEQLERKPSTPPGRLEL